MSNEKPPAKIRYKLTKLELGEMHEDQKEHMYRLWGRLSDDELERLGLERVPEGEG